MDGEFDVFGHNRLGPVTNNSSGSAASGFAGRNLHSGPVKSNALNGPLKECRAAIGGNEPRNRKASTVGAEFAAALAAAHTISIAAAVELRATCSKPENRRGAQCEWDDPCFFVDVDGLDPARSPLFE